MRNTRLVQLLLLVLLAGAMAVLLFGPQFKEHLRDIDKALSAGKKVDWWDDAALGVRYAAWVNLALLGTLLASSGWWAKPTSTAHNLQTASTSSARWFWPALLAVTLLGIGLRTPLASKSLWWDESWQMMQASHGRWKENAKNNEPGKAEFQRHDWKRAAWYYQKPTNHAPISVAQKASQSIWRLFSGAPAHEFSNLAARVPALLGSALSILLLGLLLRSWGRPGAGVAAAALLALHPWALRYGVDARGYAVVLPMVVAALLAVTRLLHTRGESWLAWLGLALAEFIWLWAYPQAVFDLVMVNLALLVLLIPHVERTGRIRMVGRLAAINLLAATLFVQAFLPNVMQATRWAGQETVAQPFSLPLLKSLLSHMFLGIAHGWPPGVEAAGLPSSLPSTVPWGLGGWILWTLPLLGLALVPIASKNFGSLRKAPWLLLAVPLLGSLLFIGVSIVTDQYFYPRFVISILPVLIAFFCLLLSGGAWRGAKAILAILLAALLLPTWWPQLKLSLERPIAPLRDVATFMQEKAQPASGNALIACFGHGREIMPLYTAEMRLIETLPELQALQQEAKAAQRPLLIAYGHTQFNSGMFPDAVQHLRDPVQFREIAAFQGLESEFYYRVLEALP